MFRMVEVEEITMQSCTIPNELRQDVVVLSRLFFTSLPL